MRPFREARWVCALTLWGLGAVPAHAAWDNVFQVCCFGCRSRPAVSNYAPAACCPAPCPQQTCCTTQYVQRSYYTPVTCYQTQVSYQPVTSYRTSYYYEPVTSYRYSCYYDPCTCSYQQIASPQTCYRLRSQTCATTSYLQRTCQVPVTSYRLSYYYEPVTTCATTPCATPCCNGASAPAPAAPAAPGVSESVAPAPAAPQPGVNESRTPANPSNGQYDRYYPQPTTPPPPAAKTNSFAAPPKAAPPPVVRLDRIVALPPTNGPLQGQVVRLDNLPQPGARLLFVHAERQAPRESATADQTGRFRVALSSGAWLVYLTGSDGKPTFHSKIEVRPDSRPVVLVSR